ncbi:MAG: hypothetical protein M1308_22255, partial [Actinobacteria bacterium]|nr:hypothetical protein [Actinomycetota bacterium]
MSGKSEEKTTRVLTALDHMEPDKIPKGEWFWSSFIENFRKYKNLPVEAQESSSTDFDIDKYFDLDIVVIMPNMDPHIKNFEIIEKTDEYIVVRTGFEAKIKKVFSQPMPMFLDFETNTIEKIKKFEFDDPKDKRRFYDVIDDQANCIGDKFAKATDSFLEKIDLKKEDYCVFGAASDVFEYLWRIIGTERALMLIATDLDVIEDFSRRITDFQVELIKEQVRAANGNVKGIYLFGDVAYKKTLLFSPETWVRVFKPCLKRLCDCIHYLGLKVIWHGCGNNEPILDDLIDAGIDCYNSIESKTGLDIVKLKKKYGKKLAYNGNINIQVLESGSFEDIENFEIIEKTDEYIVVRTGFEAKIKKVFSQPMPMFLDFET